MVSFFGTYNVRGVSTKPEQASLAEDLWNYKLQICAIQETRIQTQKSEGNIGHIRIGTTEKGNEFDLFYCNDGENNHHGVGIAVAAGIKGEFTRISERICKFTCPVDNVKSKGGCLKRRLVFISAYAPTLKTSLENPEIADKYYAELNQATEAIAARDILIVGTDSNAKCGSASDRTHPNLGLYGKGTLNANGERKLEYARRNDLVLTNTLFYQKMSHRTTWTAPERIQQITDSRTKTPRKNPYRNQIDFILVRNEHRSMIKLARSQGNLSVSTDHKLVRLTFEINLQKCYQSKAKNKNQAQYDVRVLHLPDTKKKYSELQIKYYDKEKSESEIEDKEETDPQGIWNRIVIASIKAAEEISKPTEKELKHQKKSNDKEIQELSKKQKELRNKADSAKNKEERRKIKCERNKILKKIHHKLEEFESKRIDSEIENIESISNDSNRMFRAKQFLQSLKPKQKLVLQGNEGLTTNEEDCIKIVTEHFSKVFNKENATPIPRIEAEKNDSSLQRR